VKTQGYAALSAKTKLQPFTFSRRDLGPHDVAFDILYCGICHSDIHQVNEDWGNSLFPMVPGHEIVGVVTAVGASVETFSVGQRIGVGTFIDSCRTCDSCRNGLQQYCLSGNTGTYNAVERDGVTPAFGGYSNNFVVHEDFALHIADSLDLAGVAPLLCAGITLYSPLRHWNASPGKNVGIVGLGGLGHMGVKFSHALGANTTVFSHSPDKRDDARRLGADDFVVTHNSDEMAQQNERFDLIINTASAEIDLAPYLDALNVDGTLVVVGLPGKPYRIEAWPLVTKRRSLAGSNAGGMRETREMMDFCAEHNITCDVEVVNADYINTAHIRTMNSDVKYRFVIDASTF
jgi:uncharacterized zinc-type alcohol dehydrogenase-like protein